jgi:antitoxin component of RelBE/YafQ-DinJ toxin-antitoxin module
MATTMVHVRVDEKTKQMAAKTLAAMGISVSDAVRMRAADKGKGKRLTSAGALFKDLGI